MRERRVCVRAREIARYKIMMMIMTLVGGEWHLCDKSCRITGNIRRPLPTRCKIVCQVPRAHAERVQDQGTDITEKCDREKNKENGQRVACSNDSRSILTKHIHLFIGAPATKKTRHVHATVAVTCPLSIVHNHPSTARRITA